MVKSGRCNGSVVTHGCRSDEGFTLVEVLIVVAIIGIAGAVVVPQMLRSGTLTAQAAGRMIIADLLFAQNEAMARQEPRRLVFDQGNNRYRLTDDSNNTLGVRWKAGGAGAANYVVDLANDARFRGVALDAVDFGGEAFIEYDDLGAPTSGGSVELVGPNVRYRISVTPFTGRVTIGPVDP